MATSASTILTRARSILGIDSDSVPGLEDTHMLVLTSAANFEYIDAFRSGGGEPPAFMKAEAGGTLVADTDLDESSGVATTDTTIDLTSATNFDSSGAIVVYDNDMPDVIFYTGKTSNQLTGVTGIGFAHEDADLVSKLYALPSDFNDFRQAEGYGDGVQVNGTNYTSSSGTPTGTQFAVVDNSGTLYLWFPKSMSGEYSVYYNKKTTTIDDTADNIDIP